MLHTCAGNASSVMLWSGRRTAPLLWGGGMKRLQPASLFSTTSTQAATPLPTASSSPTDSLGPPTPPPTPEDGGAPVRTYGTGRRKTSVARVWISKGEGQVTINRRQIHEYFPRQAYREKLVEPFVVTKTVGQFDVWCTVKGGGETGQAGAISLGITRALEAWNPEYRGPLAKESLFTRDPRMVERKKPGQPKARKKDQWVKR